MSEADLGRPVVFMGPSDMVVTDRPVRVKTVLGSCVAVSMLARKIGWAAITHCLMPRAGVPLHSLSRREALIYVDTAIEVMWLEMTRRGAAVEDVEVKLFGGAESVILAAGHRYQVGRLNVATADEALAARGLFPAARSTGGACGRVIEFDCATGDVMVQTLPNTPPSRPAEVA